MIDYWYISGDFLKERATRIGASDIPALIPNPERPTETLAGYGRTPITVYLEKIGEREREPAGLPAEMGHYLEGKACELFIRTFYTEQTANRHVHDRNAYEFMTRDNPDTASAQNYQNTPFYHHCQYFSDDMIVHPDVIYQPPDQAARSERKSALGITVRFGKPFLIEAKSATYWAAKRPSDSVISGYDLKLAEWQGIPLKHYMQIQFQLALLEVDDCYLALIHDTSQYHVWHIKANRAHQGKLIDLAGRMIWHIKRRRPPADLAINTEDIMALYPSVGDDFAIVNDEERDKAVEIAREYRNAETQRKRWAEKEKDALDAMAVVLRDRPEIRDGEGCIAKWSMRQGYEKVRMLSKIKGDDPVSYRYLKRKGLIESTKDSRTVKVAWKE